MEEGTKEVDGGIRLADKAGASLLEIVGISQRVTEMANQIAAASEERTSSSEQFAATAEDLSRLTESLQEVVGRFRLEAAADGPPPAVQRRTAKALRPESAVPV